MKLVLIIVDLLTVAFLYAVGRYFIKSKNTKRSILFLAGDYFGLNTQKICRVVGKRLKIGAILFLFGSIIDFVKPGTGINSRFTELRKFKLKEARPMKKVMGIIGCILGGLLVIFGIAAKVKEHSAVSVIGGADGPTSVFIAGKVNDDFMGFLIFIGVLLLAIVLIVYLKRKR